MPAGMADSTLCNIAFLADGIVCANTGLLKFVISYSLASVMIRVCRADGCGR
jgi:hypothetical protein